VSTPPKLTKEQYLAFVGGKPLDQIVVPPATLQAQQPALPPGPTQKEKDALVASLTALKDTFPGMTPLTLLPYSPPPVHSRFLCTFPLSFSRQADQVPDVRQDLR